MSTHLNRTERTIRPESDVLPKPRKRGERFRAMWRRFVTKYLSSVITAPEYKTHKVRHGRSRGAAAAHSCGRQPADENANGSEPRSGGSKRRSLSPLRGLQVWGSQFCGLTPAAMCCRRSAAERDATFRLTRRVLTALERVSGNCQRRRTHATSGTSTVGSVQTLENRLLLATFTPLASAPDGTAGSLRDVISQANSNGEDDVIMLAAGSYGIGLSNLDSQDNENLTGDFDLTESGQTIIFEGAGAGETVIDAGGIDRVFDVSENVTAIFRNLTIRDGIARDTGFPGSNTTDRDGIGGAILSEGGHVELDGVELTNNTAFGANGTTGRDGRRGYGGAVAIYNATLSVTNTSFVDNLAKGGEGGAGLPGASGSDDGGGAAGDEGGDGGQGGSALGGAIFGEDAQLILSGSTFSINRAQGGRGAQGGDGGAGATDGNGGQGGNGGDAFGGVLYINIGSLDVTDSTFDNNNAIAGDSGAGSRGGNGGSLGGGSGVPQGALGGSSTIGGRAQGGAIAVALGDVTITRSSIVGNFVQGGNGQNGGIGGQGGEGPGGAGHGGNGGNGGEGGTAQGGGVFSLRGTLTVVDSTLALNVLRGGNGGMGGPGGRAGDEATGGVGANGGIGGRGGDGQGGGAFALDVELAATNSTLSSNQTIRGLGAVGGDQGTASGQGGEGRDGTTGSDGDSQGGGLWADDATEAVLLSTTIAVNESTSGEGSGVYNDGSLDIELHNVLIGANSEDLDYEGHIQAGSSYNVIGNSSRLIGISDGVDSNQLGTALSVLNIGISGLADNGGPTQTHALLETSLAVDTGDRGRTPLFDQRGVLRPVQSPVDVGAFEAQRTLTVLLPAGGGDYRVIGDGSDAIVRRETGEELFRYEYTALHQIILVASPETDSVTIDFSATDAVPQGGVVFQGTPGGGDSLTLEGTSASAVGYSLTDPGSGTIDADGALVFYENVASVLDALPAPARSVQFGNDTDVVTLGAGASSGQTRLGHGAAVLDFASPATTLDLNLGDGDDSLTITLPDAAFVAGVVIEAGDGNDLVNAESFGRRVTARGGAGNDSLWGGELPDLLEGGLGDDQLKGNGGADRFFGEGGRDTMFGGHGKDTMYGGSGNDLLLGEYDADMLFGEDGDDNVRGQGGSGDRVSGGDGDDTAAGGSGNDILVESGDVDFRLTRSRLLGRGNDLAITNEFALITGGESDNVLDGREAIGIGVWFRGGAGNDVLYGSAGNDDLQGEAGDDLIVAAAGNDVLLGGDGNDDLRGDAGSDVISGGDGNDVADGGADDDVIGGDAGADDLRGGDGNDVLNGDADDDELRGGAGEDVLNGGAGSDLLDGEADADVISGGDGDDRASGGDGDDSVNGDDGHDRIFGDAGNDDLRGGPGGDNIHGGTGSDIIHGDDGGDWLFGNDGADSIYGGMGRDGLLGDAGNDFLLGDGDEDSLSGGAGNDQLLGSGGADLLLGGDGDDVLRGQASTDILAGGDGADQFLDADADTIDESAVLRASFAADSGLLTVLTPAGVTVTIRDYFSKVRVEFDGVVVDEVFAVDVPTVRGVLVRGSSGNDNVDLTQVTTEMFTGLATDGVVLLGEAGDDDLTGSEFKDLLVGGPGHDVLRGGKEQDTARGGDGDDSIFGDRAEDHLSGDAGADYLDGGDNADHIEGGEGNDILRGRSGNDSLFGGGGDDGLAGHRGNDLLDGGLGNDILLGGDNDDGVFGGAGSDIVLGELGSDFVKGNGGADILAGGHGYGQPDHGDVVNGSLGEIDEFFVFEADWVEDV